MLAGVTDVKMNKKTKHNKKESGSFQVVEPYEWNCVFNLHWLVSTLRQLTVEVNDTHH